MLITQVLPLDLSASDAPAAADPVDLRLREGVIAEIGPRLAPRPGEEVHDGGGAIAIPGLWDHHVHVGQAAQQYSRLDTSAATSVDELLALVRADAGRSRGTLVGFGHRLVDLEGSPSVAALDAAAGPGRPVVLIGGDAHHAWASTAALDALGVPRREGIIAEDEWFDALAHLDDLPGVSAGLETGVKRLQDDALARGIVGLTDMEWSTNWRLWQRREARLRVRTATYASGIEQVPGPTGTVLDERGLATMGPLKVIADGSLGSRSAFCRHPYPGAEAQRGGYGVLSDIALELPELLGRAQQLGLEAAVHAIGDAAAGVVLEAFAARGMGGRIEHAQQLEDADIAAMARLGVRASVQPAHLLEDRDPTEEIWGEDARQAYRFADLSRAGVPMLMGSDAPIAPVDPWLAMAAAVHRSADERTAWYPSQQLQPLQALAASTDAVAALEVGGRADLVLLERDVFAPVPRGADGLMVDAAAREAAAALREVRLLATVVAGEVAFSR